MAILSYDGVESTATFKMTTALKTIVDADTQEIKGYGLGVQLSDADTVDIGTAAGKALFGILIQSDGRGLATIKFKGGIENVKIEKIGGTPALPVIGYGGLGVNATGGIVTFATGRNAYVVNVDETKSTATLIL